MKKNKIIVGGVLGVIILIILGVMVLNKKTDLSLTDGYTEIDLNEREIYKSEEAKTSLVESFYSLNNYSTISIVDGKIKIELSDSSDVIEKEIKAEKVFSLLSSSACGASDEEPERIYVLTEKKNVYKMELVYNENYDLTKDVFRGYFQKVYDGSKLQEDDNVSLISLNSNTTRVTCFTKDVYLKINDKVYDFSGVSYTETGTARNYEASKCGNIRYNFDGTLEISIGKEITKVKNADGKVIKAIIYGTENNQDYMIDEEGNEYYFKQNMFESICENNGILTPTSKNKIQKIGKKGLEYEILFENNNKKHITIEAGWSVFDEIV